MFVKFGKPQFDFDENSNAGGAGATPDPAKGGSQADGAGAGAETRTFTQEQVNQIVQDRLTRDKNATTTELLTALGIKDTEEGKKLIAEAKKSAADKLTEDEKKAAATKAIEDAAQKATADAAEATKKASERALQADVKLAAHEAGFRPDAIDDVFLVIDRTKITEKDGEFTGVKEAVEAVSKAKPHWMADQKTANGKPPAGTPNGKPKNPNQTGNQGDQQTQRRAPTL